MTSNIYRLDYEKAEILMKADSQVEKDYRLQACRKEPWTVAWIESMPKESWFYDVGASTGPYTLLAAKLGVRVVAFEPQPSSMARLLENVTGNKLNEMVSCMPVALSSADGAKTLHYLSMEPGRTVFNEGITREAKRRGMKEEVQSYAHHTLGFALDTLVRELGFPAPNYIKVDTDDGELSVLEGMRWCLAHAEFRSVMVEVDPETREPIYALMQGCGLVLKEEYGKRDFKPYKPQPYCLFCKPELKYG